MDPLSMVFSVLVVDFLGACVGGIVGNRADKVYCDVMRGLVERLHEGDLPVNGDVQRGIRTAYIQATLVVIDKCLAQLGVEPTTVGTGLGRFGIQSTIVGRRRDKVGHGDEEEVAWLEDVQRAYREELRNLPDNNASRPTPEAEARIELLLQPRGVTAQDRAIELQESLKHGLIDELRQRFGYRDLVVARHLDTLLQQGWDEPARRDEVVHLDWFQAFCAFFAEEYKTNERLRGIFEGKLLAQLSVDGAPLAPQLDAFLRQLDAFLSQFDGLRQTLDEIRVQTRLLSDMKAQQDEIHEQTAMLPDIRTQQDVIASDVGVIRKVVEETQADRFEREKRTPFQVPFRTDAFVGREDDLAAVRDGLTGGSAVVIAGPGGMGKTFLAGAYAHRYKDEYPGGVFWLSIADAVDADVEAQVAACGGPGGLALPGWDALDQAGKVAAVRAAWQSEERRLLILDNLEEPKKLSQWRPTTGGCQVLVTSRDDRWPPLGGVQVHKLDELTRADGLELLCGPWAAATGVPLQELMADAAADRICDEVGDLPLALALAGLYVGEYGMSFSAYLVKLQAQLLLHVSLARLGDDDDLPELPTKHIPALAATFALSYERLDATKAVDALALRLLRRATVLAAAPIPRDVLLRAGDDDGAAVDEDGPEQKALRRLGAVGLIREDRGDSVRLHRLVAAFVRLRVYETDDGVGTELKESDTAAVTEALIASTNAVIESGYPLAGVAYLPHPRQVMVELDTAGDQEVIFARLTNSLARLLRVQGDYAGARPLYERALAIRERALGPDHPDVANSLNNLATLLSDQGDYAEARPLYERALAIRERALGPDHPDVANSLNNLATLLRDQGDYAEARPLYERALAIRERALGPDHPDVANSLNNLATLLYNQGDYAEARPLYERALAIRERALGPDHSITRLVRNNLESLPGSEE